MQMKRRCFAAPLGGFRHFWRCGSRWMLSPGSAPAEVRCRLMSKSIFGDSKAIEPPINAVEYGSTKQ